MAVNVGSYGGYYTGREYYQTRTERESDTAISAGEYEARKEMGVGETEGTSYGNARLSSQAQAMLEKLKKTYSNMDFMVADFANGADARKILSRGTKEFSVLFSPEELEKMASDEKYEKEYMAKIEGAVRMSEQINEQFGYERGLGNNTKNGSLTKIGISFNSDGTTTLFAELEKVTDKQAERIEKARAKHAEERKNEREAVAEKYETGSVTKETAGVRKIVVQASTIEELIQRLREADFNGISEEKKAEGDRFDFSV